MNANRQDEEDEAQTRQMTRTVKDYKAGVVEMVCAMVEYAHRDAQHGDVDAKLFIQDWQAYFADRHHDR